jgi:hypothetical protein
MICHNRTPRLGGETGSTDTAIGQSNTAPRYLK